MEKFEKLKKLGEGTYGKVYKVMDRTNKEIYAVKKIRLVKDNLGVPNFALREISLLKEMDHKNIVRLLDVIHNEKVLCLVFEFLDMDLRKYMFTFPDFSKDQDQIKRFLYQILDALSFCHSRRIVHRDIKPQNLLIDQGTQTIKLADFGMARAFDVTLKTYTQEVTSLGYRAPERLLGPHSYSTPVDIWAVGCIFAEMVNYGPLFAGNSELSHLLNMFRKLGTPNDDIWPGVSSYPYYKKTVFPQWSSQSLGSLLPSLCSNGIDLLSRMLCYDPSQRICGMKINPHIRLPALTTTTIIYTESTHSPSFICLMTTTILINHFDLASFN